MRTVFQRLCLFITHAVFSWCLLLTIERLWRSSIGGVVRDCTELDRKPRILWRPCFVWKDGFHGLKKCKNNTSHFYYLLRLPFEQSNHIYYRCKCVCHPAEIFFWEETDITFFVCSNVAGACCFSHETNFFWQHSNNLYRHSNKGQGTFGLCNIWRRNQHHFLQAFF